MGRLSQAMLYMPPGMRTVCHPLRPLIDLFGTCKHYLASSDSRQPHAYMLWFTVYAQPIWRGAAWD